VKEVGKTADLEKDIRELREKGRFGEAVSIPYRGELLEDVVERFGKTARMMHPFAAPYLLLRLGEVVKVGDDPGSFDPFAVSNPFKLEVVSDQSDEEEADVFIDFAYHVRADGVAAGLGKDDGVAAERLVLFDAMWAEASRRLPKGGVNRGDPDDPFDVVTPKQLPEINMSWREFLVDARRRMKEEPRTAGSDLEKAITSWEDLEAWDESVTPAAYRKVVSARATAIRPLLKCLETDDRWTRIVAEIRWQNRPWRVRDLAILALHEVLGFEVVEFPNSEGPVQLEWYQEAAVKLRRFCERYEYQVGGELWYRILKNQKGDLDQQAAAAVLIVEPRGAGPYYGVTGSFFLLEEIRDRYGQPNSSAEGAGLRGRSASIQM